MIACGLQTSDGCFCQRQILRREETQPWWREFVPLEGKLRLYAKGYKAWVSVQPLLLIGYVASGKFPAVSEPQFPLKEGDSGSDSAVMRPGVHLLFSWTLHWVP